MQGNNQTIQGLVGEALRESTDLAQKELTLFRTEISQNIRTLFMGLAMVVVAAIFAIAAVMLLTESLVEWLATVVNSEALAALIVGGVMAADRHRTRAVGPQHHDIVLACAGENDALAQARCGSSVGKRCMMTQSLQDLEQDIARAAPSSTGPSIVCRTRCPSRASSTTCSALRAPVNTGRSMTGFWKRSNAIRFP